MADTRETTVEEFFGQPVSTYTDAQAVEDGVLASLDGVRGQNNRVTRALWDELSATFGGGALEIIDLTRILALWDTMEALEPDQDGWRVRQIDGRTYWMVPNEIGGLTLMNPSDW